MAEDSIFAERLRNKDKTKKLIEEKVANESLSPTKTEKVAINDIIQTISGRFSRELTDKTMDKKELEKKIEDAIMEEIGSLKINFETKKRLERMAVESIIGYGPIQPYLRDPEVTEIVVQRFDNICIERRGKIMTVKGRFTDENHLRNVINRILQPVGREVNIATPIVDAHLEDGSRVCATIPPVSPKGSTLDIRKFNNSMMTADKYLEFGSISKDMLDFMIACIKGKVSIFVSGGTGTGKTTFLNMLSSYIPNNELIITIEDTLELQLKQKNVRSLETRQNNSGNMMVVDMAALVKASLRMRPDRIVVGETRDGSVVSLLNAMSTGHEGSMSTGHANSPENLVNVRIPTMMEMDKSTSFTERAQANMISEAIQIVVQLRRIPKTGARVVSQICAVTGVDKNNKVMIRNIFYYDFKTDEYVFTGEIPEHIVEYLERYGVIVSNDMYHTQKRETKPRD